MVFKNYRRVALRITAAIGGHTVVFAPGEELDIPEHLEETVLAGGAVPMEGIEDFEARKEKEAQAIEAEQEAAAVAEVEAEQQRAQALAVEAEKAELIASEKRAAAGRKSAATRKANADAKKQA
jgi:hypothetical protein